MPIEHGDVAAGEGGAGRVVGIEGDKVRVKLFPPDSDPDMATAVVTIGPVVKHIAKGPPSAVETAWLAIAQPAGRKRTKPRR